MPEMFDGLEESEIVGGNFRADGEGNMFGNSKKLDIGGGVFLATTARRGKGLAESDSGGMTTLFNSFFLLTAEPRPFQMMDRRCSKAFSNPRSPMESSLLKETGRCLRSPKISLSAEGITPLLGQVHERVKLHRNLTNKVCISSRDNFHFVHLRALYIQPIRQHRRFNFWVPLSIMCRDGNSPMTLTFSGPSFPIPAPYNPTPIRQPALQPQSVPATSSGPTYQSDAAFGTSVPLTYTHTAPALPSEAQDYFPNYDVPNHQIPQIPKNVVQGSSSTNSVAAPMEADANNEVPSESDTGTGKKKDNSKHHSNVSEPAILTIVFDTPRILRYQEDVKETRYIPHVENLVICSRVQGNDFRTILMSSYDVREVFVPYFMRVN